MDEKTLENTVNDRRILRESKFKTEYLAHIIEEIQRTDNEQNGGNVK